MATDDCQHARQALHSLPCALAGQVCLVPFHPTVEVLTPSLFATDAGAIPFTFKADNRTTRLLANLPCFMANCATVESSLVGNQKRISGKAKAIRLIASRCKMP